MGEAEERTMDDIRGKVIIVGDGAIGKTCLISRLMNKEEDWTDPPDYEPTTFNNFTVQFPMPDGSMVDIELWDTAGQESFTQLRKLSYPGTDIFIIGYDTNSQSSLSNVQHKWLPEIREETSCKEDPWIVLCGTKVDMRTPDNANRVKEGEAEGVAKAIKAAHFVETSAKTNIGVTDLMNHVTQLAWDKNHNKPLVAWEPEKPKVAPAAGKPTVKEDNFYAANTQKKGGAASGSTAQTTQGQSDAAKSADPPTNPPSNDKGCQCVMM